MFRVPCFRVRDGVSGFRFRSPIFDLFVPRFAGWGSGFRMSWVPGSGVLGSGVSGLGSQGFGSRAPGFRVLGSRVLNVSGSRVSGFEFEGFGLRVSGGYHEADASFLVGVLDRLPLSQFPAEVLQSHSERVLYC